MLARALSSLSLAALSALVRIMSDAEPATPVGATTRPPFGLLSPFRGARGKAAASPGDEKALLEALATRLKAAQEAPTEDVAGELEALACDLQEALAGEETTPVRDEGLAAARVDFFKAFQALAVTVPAAIGASIQLLERWASGGQQAQQTSPRKPEPEVLASTPEPSTVPEPAPVFSPAAFTRNLPAGLPSRGSAPVLSPQPEVIAAKDLPLPAPAVTPAAAAKAAPAASQGCACTIS